MNNSPMKPRAVCNGLFAIFFAARQTSKVRDFIWPIVASVKAICLSEYLYILEQFLDIPTD